jgi:hypothetical protein
VSHFHSRRQLGIYQLGDHHTPRGAIVLRPVEQRHSPEKDGMTATLHLPKQA